MSEKILKALMQLFAIIGNIEKDGIHGRNTVEFFLRQQLNKELVKAYLKIYDDYYASFTNEAEGDKKRKKTSVSAVKVIVICRQINEALTQKQKMLVLIRLIEFVKSNNEIGELESEFISTVSSEFNIPDDEYLLLVSFILNDNPDLIPDSNEILVISNTKSGNKDQHVKHLFAEGLGSVIHVMRIKSTGMYLMNGYGNQEIYLSGQFAADKRIHILTQGSTIRSSKLLPIYYSDIVARFLSDNEQQNISFKVQQIEFAFKNGKKGLQEISFAENSGKMIGIMGGSGAGKSTLLNVLNGNEVPSSGRVLVNGIDLHTQRKQLQGVIGYVPQDDLLIDELTVYQNLFYNTRLCFANYSDEKIGELVDKLLVTIGLEETRNLHVGNPLQKTISGGQRKRLNIALELIREPAILFVDEPTSGLSSRDSENIMDLLKELSLRGKLVFVVIHQPSSDIFKLFDKLLILDLGGYPVYYGNPVESLIYFKKAVNYINAMEAECESCGNVNPEQVFNIIESKVLDENGKPTSTRRISPEEWNEEFKKNYTPHASSNEPEEPVKSDFKKPGFFAQAKVYLTRDVLAKLGNKQYLFINFLEAPVLALILALLTKYYRNGKEYIFSENKNLVAYIFMCVVVSLFIGLTVSAEEIIKDRKILKREKFLNLSRGSYLLSKIILVFSMSAIQMLCLVLVGNYILEIKGMYLDYWLVLFATSCFANMLGLNISSAFDSNVTIYILIPFLLIPQLLLSGVIVKFDELHPNLSGKSVVPLTGDLMASRWAFEALAVNQFMNNDYEKNLYPYEKQLAHSIYKRSHWHDKMQEILASCNETFTSGKKGEELEKLLEVLKNEITAEEKKSGIRCAFLTELNPTSFKESTAKSISQYLGQVKKHYAGAYNMESEKMDNYLFSIQKTEAAKSNFNTLREQNHNRKLEELVKDDHIFTDPTYIENGRIYSNETPVYVDAAPDKLIRAHLYSPTKSFLGKLIPSFRMNLIVIWLMSGILMITLYFNLLRKFIRFISMRPILKRK